jgi:hypothetical protein
MVSLILGRGDDNWGVGWAGTHISSDLRGVTNLNKLDSYKHALEVFSNVEVTPAVICYSQCSSGGFRGEITRYGRGHRGALAGDVLMHHGKTLGEPRLNLGKYVSKMARLIKIRCDLEIDIGICGFRRYVGSAERGQLLHMPRMYRMLLG